MFIHAGRYQLTALFGAIVAIGLAFPSPATAEPLENIKTVIIDAGHGGDDFGAKNPNIIIEKDFTLKVAQVLKKLIRKENGKRVKVVMTRPRKKGAGQEERAFTANKNQGDIFISIHTASGFDQSSRDLGIFIMPNRRGISWKEANARHAIENEKLALNMMKSLNSFYRHKKFVIRKGEFIPLFCIDMPTVTIEVAALNDPRDELYLSRKGYYRNMASAIYEAIVSYDRTHERPNRYEKTVE